MIRKVLISHGFKLKNHQHFCTKCRPILNKVCMGKSHWMKWITSNPKWILINNTTKRINEKKCKSIYGVEVSDDCNRLLKSAEIRQN